MQTRAGPTLPDKQETSLWSVGVEVGEQVCRGGQDTATGTRPGTQSTRVKRTAGNNSLGTRKPRLGHRRAEGVKTLQAQGLRYLASASEGPWQGRSGPGLQDQWGPVYSGPVAEAEHHQMSPVSQGKGQGEQDTHSS